MHCDIESVELNRSGDAPLFIRNGVDALTELTRPYAVEKNDIVVYKCFMGIVRLLDWIVEVQLVCVFVGSFFNCRFDIGSVGKNCQICRCGIGRRAISRRRIDSRFRSGK